MVGEPQGSPGWYPANDTPRDKATYTVQMTVPDGLTAVGNGTLEGRFSRGGRTTFRWRERYPMAPYLATITLGRFDVATGRTPSGVPTYVAVDPTQAADAAPVLAELPDMVSFLERFYGPRVRLGAVRGDPAARAVTHVVRRRGDAADLAGSLAPRGLRDLSEWAWAEHSGGPTTAEQFAELAATPASDTKFWNPPPGNPGGPENVFDGTVYDRGAMTLEALRERIGARAFVTVLRRWYAEHRYGNVSTPEFVALAERVSGRRLGAFFQRWLYTPGKPGGLPETTAASGERRGKAIGGRR